MSALSVSRRSVCPWVLLATTLLLSACVTVKSKDKTNNDSAIFLCADICEEAMANPLTSSCLTTCGYEAAEDIDASASATVSSFLTASGDAFLDGGIRCDLVFDDTCPEASECSSVLAMCLEERVEVDPGDIDPCFHTYDECVRTAGCLDSHEECVDLAASSREDCIAEGTSAIDCARLGQRLLRSCDESRDDCLAAEP